MLTQVESKFRIMLIRSFWTKFNYLCFYRTYITWIRTKLWKLRTIGNLMKWKNKIRTFIC
jgi:hypothetical protein